MSQKKSSKIELFLQKREEKKREKFIFYVGEALKKWKYLPPEFKELTEETVLSGIDTFLNSSPGRGISKVKGALKTISNLDFWDISKEETLSQKEKEIICNFLSELFPEKYFTAPYDSSPKPDHFSAMMV